jgi:phosphomannomutase
MQSLKIKFGTDGWRAVMDKEYTFENVEKVAQAFCDFFKSKSKKEGKTSKLRVAIGYDFRKNSEKYAQHFARVLHANGVETILSDRAVTTPAVSRAVIERGLDAGIGITASHNPASYNGVKIKDYQGASAGPDITSGVENLFGQNPVKKDDSFDVAPLLQDISSDYFDKLKAYLDLSSFSGKYKILVDSMHGVGERHLEVILKNTPLQITTIRGNRDVTFGGNAPEPVLKNLKKAAQMMRSDDFDLAVATDGDADRIAAIRPGGAFVSPGTILSLILLHFVEDLGLKGSVVTTVSNTSLIYSITRRLKLKTHETPVGFKHICEIIKNETVLIAGEESGGLAFHNYMPERDGLLSALLLIQMMCHRKQSFEEILQGVEETYGKFYYVRHDEEFPAELKPKLVAHLKSLELTDLEGKKVREKNMKDGVKFILENDAWVLFRLSGTEPLLRIYAESTDQSLANALVRWGRSLASSIS